MTTQIPPQPSWGWKLPCNEPGCEACLTGWKEAQKGRYTPYGFEVGPPALSPVMGENRGEGWWFSSHKHPSWDYTVFWRAYCPEHSAPVYAWQEALKEWKTKRHSKGKREATRLKQETLLTKAANTFRTLVGLKVREWVEENPRPQAPWEVA